MSAPTLPPLPPGVRYCDNGNGQRICTGAVMGAPDTLPEAAQRQLPCKLRLVRLPWVDGDYIPSGAYFGRSNDRSSIYRAIGDCGDVRAEIFVRAIGREQAKSKVRNRLPNARFYR